MQRGLSLAIGVVAVVAALGAGWLLDDAKRGAAAVTPPPDAATAASASEATRAVGTASSPATPPDAAELLAKYLGEKLDAATEAAVRDRAKGLREYGRELTETADKLAADEWERTIRQDRAQRGSRLGAGNGAFLEGLARNWTPQWSFVRARQEYAALFMPTVSAGDVDGPSLSYAQSPPSGSTIRFPAGQFALDVSAMNVWAPCPRDLVLAGAGMDATLLVTNSYVDFRSGSLASLTFRDLTIHTDDRDLARIRDALFTIRMERCRVIGFDTAAACASMLAGQVGAFWAKDCRFEAGFGRSPGDGVLFDVRGMLLARFDNCDVVGTIGLGVGTMCSTQVFANCRFTRQAPYVREGFERPRGGTAEFTGSTFQYLASNQDKAARAKRSVTEFNPAWKDPKR